MIRPQAERWTRTRTRREIVDRFAALGLPAGEVQTIEEVYECPHLAARNMFLDVYDPQGGRRRMIRTPVLLADYDEPRAASAPQLRAGNDTILAAA